MTQLFYDVDRFFKFGKDCRSLGITCPIIPGALAYSACQRTAKAACMSVPLHVSLGPLARECSFFTAIALEPLYS